MLYRCATIGIIAFWLVMMGMLVRLETHPEATDILDVPVSYVARIMFKNGQRSLLNVRQENNQIGSFSLHPSITGSSSRALDFSGTLALQLPVGAAQRLNFHGVLDMDIAMRIVDFHLEVNMQEPHYHITADGDVARKTVTFEIRERNHVIASQTLPLDAAALGPALSQNFGIPGNALTPGPGGIAPPAVTAREAQITMHSEQLQVYEVSVGEVTNPLVRFYVTQLGQVVLAKTNFGFTLSAEDSE
jgi:hypothetical protein